MPVAGLNIGIAARFTTAAASKPASAAAAAARREAFTVKLDRLLAATVNCSQPWPSVGCRSGCCCGMLNLFCPCPVPIHANQGLPLYQHGATPPFANTKPQFMPVNHHTIPVQHRARWAGQLSGSAERLRWQLWRPDCLESSQPEVGGSVKMQAAIQHNQQALQAPKCRRLYSTTRGSGGSKCAIV